MKFFLNSVDRLCFANIDDMIKITDILSFLKLLHNTFTMPELQLMSSFPEFYKELKEALNPYFFYLSASPYNLYPFLHLFIQKYYPFGQL